MKKKIYNYKKIFSLLICLIVLGSSIFAVEVSETFITDNSIIGGLNYTDKICILIQKAITVLLGFTLVFELITVIANY